MRDEAGRDRVYTRVARYLVAGCVLQKIGHEMVWASSGKYVPHYDVPGGKSSGMLYERYPFQI
jgi:hypothetical protein